MSDESSAAIESRTEFHEHIRAALVKAAEAGAEEIFLVDPNFADWPLNERSVVESLSKWASARRRLTVFAHSFDGLARQAPRFVEWRRDWSHVVQCRSDDEIEAEHVPTILYVPHHVALRLHDPLRYRGTASSSALDQVQCRETIDALLQRSSEAFPVTMLGL